jgi:outer membrane protein insertion porin family
MAVAPLDRNRLALGLALAVVAALLLSAQPVRAQLNDPTRDPLFDSQRGSSMGMTRGPGLLPNRKADEKKDKKISDPTDFEPMRPGDIPVVEVRIEGNKTIKKERILPNIHTRAGRPYRPSTIAKDVDRLHRTRLFVTIDTLYQDVPAGRIVIFRVVERPLLAYVRYVGNKKIKEKTLAKETALKEGEAADPFAIEEARRAIEALYHQKGFSRARVSVAEGSKPGDRGAVFVINEGPKLRVLWTDFVGNTTSVAPDGRLLNLVKSKQGILWIFKGEYDPKQIEADKETLTAYYRSLGFFQARVGAEVTFPENSQWARVHFVIDEGIRWKVRDVSYFGNSKIGMEKLQDATKLHSGEFFNQNTMNADIRKMREQYGTKGYVFTEVKAEPRFLEEPGQLDLVYNITEGDQYHVGRINPKITGDNPHTRITTLLNPLSLVPGDIANTKEMHASEMRYLASEVFNSDRQRGQIPKIVFTPPEAKDVPTEERPQMAQPPRAPGNFRGQSPDDQCIPPATRFSPRPVAAPPVAPSLSPCLIIRWPNGSTSTVPQPAAYCLRPTAYGQRPYSQDGGAR